MAEEKNTEVLDDSLNVRANSTKLHAFKKRCKEMNRDYPDIVREMVDAFSEGRLKIQPTDQQRKLNKELYHDD